ncbi:MAG: phosphoribosylglycinamide formyltransferase [Pseudomonadota bacterium]
MASDSPGGVAGRSGSPLRVVVLLSGRGSNLDALIRKAGPFVIAAVVSNVASAPGLKRATEAGIPTICLPHGEFSSRQGFEQALAQELHSLRPDLLVLAGFMRVLGSHFVRQFEGRMINIHPSLLPRYRGLHTHQRVLDAGDETHGASVHFVTAELDGGPVIAQVSMPVRATDSAESLADRLLPLEHQLLTRVVLMFAKGQLGYDNAQAIFDQAALAAPLRLQPDPAGTGAGG